jgi:hypothetical protein
MKKKAKKENKNQLPDTEATNHGNYRELQSEQINSSKKPEKTLYNLSELQKMTGNNNEFLHHAISIFIQSSEEAVLNLKKDLGKGDWLKIKEVAHKVLPSYRHLEVNEVIPKLAELNNRIRHDEVNAGLHSLVSEVITKMEIVVKELRKELL